MKRFSLLMLLASACFFALPSYAEKVYFEDGSSAEIPPAHKVVFIPRWVNPDTLVQIRNGLVKPVVIPAEPQEPDCTPEGELSTGALPCEE